MKKCVLLPMLPLVLLSLMATSCSVYYPECVDIPLIQEKGEVQLEGAVVPAGNDIDACWRGSVAYGITNHLAASVSLDPMRRYSQVMAGTYFPVGERFVWELYGGLGSGKGKQYVDYDPAYSSTGKHRIVFLQGDAGWQNLTRFLNLDIAFSLKTGYMYRYLNVGDGTMEIYDSVTANTNYYSGYHNAVEHCLLVEPTVEVRFGWPNFKFNVKAGYAHIFGTKEGRYNSFAIGVGMSYRFDTRK